MQKSDAARIIAGLTPAETKQSSAPTSVHVMSGEVVGNSESGKVQIRMDGDVVSPNDDQIIEIDALGGLEEGDTATILLTGQPGRAMTPMVMGSSGSVDRIVERIKTIEADYIKATEIEAEVATFGYLKASELETEVGKFGYLKANQLEAEVATFGYLKADDLEAEVAEFGYLKANSATITDLQADTAKIHNLSANDISAATGYIHDLTSGNVTAQNIIADHGDFSTVKANAAKVANLTAQELEADHATIANLDSSYAQIDMANVNNAWIANGLIKDAAIKSEMVESISANQLTAGEIDADEITVRNLQASSLTVQTADGYVYVGEKRIPTKEFIDSLKDELQNEIDGAIETFTVSAVPTLNNTPANEWVVSGDAEATRKLRAKHVGDIAYVVNSSSAQNGYCYRFAYDATAQEFKWVLIKDSDVTAALSRLSTAEGKITGLETFESNTTTWMNETDDGLETIRTNHTNLSGRVDKTVVETKQLWFTKANTTAPNKPTTAVTSTSTAGNAWRVVVPAWNASYPNYYYCLQYKLADGTYAWSDVVRDIAMGESQQQGRKGVADAATADGKAVSAQNTANTNIKSSVQLWFTKANSTAPDKPTAQVSTNSASTTNAWNLAIPTYNSSYPHYFYCYQQQKGDGTYQWSDVVYDRSVTEAQAKAQAALPSSTFTTFQSTTFKNLVDTVDEQSSTITQLSDSVSSVGNILEGTVANPSNWIISAPSGASYTKEAYGTAGVKVTFNSVGGFEWLYSQPIAVTSGNKYMVFFDYTVGKTYTTTSGKSGYGLVAYSGSNAPSGSYDDGNARFLGKAEFSKTASGDRVLKGSFTFTATSDGIVLGLNGGQIADNQTGLSFTLDNLVVGETLSTTSNTVNSVKQTATDNSAHIGNLTTTLGTNADGTSKSEDIVHKYNTLDQTMNATVSRVGTTETKLQTISNPNLSPFFSMAPYRTATSYDGVYWQPTAQNWLMGGVTKLSDGWAHVTRGASTSLEVAIPRIESLSAGDKATLMIEWRNVTVTGSPNIYARNYPENCQFNLNSYKVTWTSNSETNGSKLIIMTVNSTATGDKTWNAAIDLGMSNGSGVSFDGDLRISLYEGEYDGPYKPYVDQSLSERVSTAETSIEQNATDITLRATKTEAYQFAQPNLSPFFSMDFVDVYNANTNPKGYWYPHATLLHKGFTQLEDGWAHFEYTNSTSSAYYPKFWAAASATPTSLKPSTKYTFLLELRNWSAGNASTWIGLATNNATYTDVFSGSITKTVGTSPEPAYYVTATTEADITGKVLFNYGEICVYAGDTVSGDIRISLYEGEYSGPYKPYSGTQLYASQSELKITADGITSTVEGISSYKYCETGYRYALADIKTYSAEGYSGTWRVSQDYNLRIGDTVYLKIYDVTRNCNVYIKGTVTAKSSATRITITSHGYEDILPVETIKSTINQSSDSVKIQAKHVEIDGTAIFTDTNFQSNLTTKLDSIKVGGTNLLRGTGTGEGWTCTSFDKETRTFTRSTTATGESYIFANSNSYLMYKLGTEYVLSCWAKSNGQVKDMDIFTYDQNTKNIKSRTYSVTTEWVRFIFPFKYDAWSTSSATPTGFHIRFDNNGSKTSGTEAILYVRDVKLECGNKVTDWSPAPEDTHQYRVVTTSYSYTLAQWLTYAEEGYTGSWSTGTSGQGVRAGDTVMLKGTNRGNGSAVYVLMTVNTLNTSGAIANATSHGLIDPTAGQRADSAQSTANAAAPKASAVKRTQRIWYRKSASGAPDTPGTASSNWVTKADDGNDAWTKMHIAINSTHKHIYTCEQYEMANGTVGYTSVLLDNTITVIDGGTIITGSIAANSINASSGTFDTALIPQLTADHIAAGSISIGKLDTSTQNKITTSENKLAHTLQGIKHTWSNDSTTRYVELCKSTINCNSSSATGAIHIHGMIGGWVNNVQGHIDLTIGCRGVPPYAIVKQKDSTVNYDFGNIVAYYDSSYVVHVYLVKPAAGTYAKCVLEMDAIDQFERVDTIGTAAPSGTKFFDLSQATTEDSRTATTYLTDGGSNGLMVHPSNDANTGVRITSDVDIVRAGNVMNRIDANGMTLYDGNGVADSNIVAKFAANLVELGKGSTDTVIKFCNGMGDISYNADTKFINLNSLRLSNYAKSNGTDMAASQIAAHFDTNAGENFANVIAEANSGYTRVLMSATRPVSGGDPMQASIESYATGTEGHITFYGNSFIFSWPGNPTGQTIKAIYAGSTVVNLSNGKWLSLADPTVVAQKLGSGASQGNTICIAQNGGHESYSGVVTGAMGSDGSARAYIYPNHTGYIRINFILIRFA